MDYIEENNRQVRNMRTNCKYLRIAHGCTVEQLSAQTQISKEDLLAIENGQDFELSLLIRLCRFYQVSPCQLFGTLDTQCNFNGNGK